MFRSGLLEGAATCAVVILAIIIPVPIARGHARLDKRLKSIDNKLEKKKVLSGTIWGETNDP